MITIDQAKSLRHGSTIHYNGCRQRIGPRGGRSLFIQRFRVTGKIILWKKSPESFKLPIKFGREDSMYVTERNAGFFHLENECSVLFEKKGA
jgi:hypothetical protein